MGISSPCPECTDGITSTGVKCPTCDGRGVICGAEFALRSRGRVFDLVCTMKPGHEPPEPSLHAPEGKPSLPVHRDDRQLPPKTWKAPHVDRS